MIGGRKLFVVDTHTAGEPMRIVVGGLAFLRGRSMAQKMEDMKEGYDDVRRALMLEPRGHMGMGGAVICEPCQADCDLGVFYMHPGGYAPMCGHGSIAVARAALEIGLVPTVEPVSTVRLDTPAGPVGAEAEIRDGVVGLIRITNVPSYVWRPEVRLEVDGLRLTANLAYGGNLFAIIDVTGTDLFPFRSRVVDCVKVALRSRENLQDRLGPELKADGLELDHVMFIARSGRLHYCNLVVFGQGQFDRSPCGTGTSAMLAVLQHRGELETGKQCTSEGVIGTRFQARIAGTATAAGRPAIIPEIAGEAFITGYNQITVEARDQLREGFLIDG